MNWVFQWLPRKQYALASCCHLRVLSVDTQNMESRLPSDKLTKCRDSIQHFLRREKITLRELQYLIGLLNFTCSVIMPGRTFLRRLINLTVGVKRPRYFIRLNQETKSDLQWQVFLFRL